MNALAGYERPRSGYASRRVATPSAASAIRWRWLQR